MQKLTERIMKLAQGLPEGAPIAAKTLLHMGHRAAVDQALSRLVRRGHLLRASRGLYVRPVETRYGVRAPSVERVVEAIASQRGESVASSGAAAANALGLSSQVPVRAVYLTSGPSRKLKLGAQIVELKQRRAGSWCWPTGPPRSAPGSRVDPPTKATEALSTIQRKLPEADCERS